MELRAAAPVLRSLRAAAVLRQHIATSRLFLNRRLASTETSPPPVGSTSLASSFLEPTAPSSALGQAAAPHIVASPSPTHTSRRSLPTTCPGCGALTQDVETGRAGFYSRSRKTVAKYLSGSAEHDRARQPEEDLVSDKSPAPAESAIGSGDGPMPLPSAEVTAPRPLPMDPIPVCDRCHYLKNEMRGVPIAHPSIEDIADSIAESPHNRNHVFHVMDAADFPMSLIRGIHKDLSLAKSRTQNRRSQHNFSQKPTLSFIVTRSDLLGPTKEMVDRLMPYVISVLRDALGRQGEKMRLGNVHLVSAKRGWWTKDIKDTIWSRGGGNWLVGKFNVGKSNLFEVLFPKGSGHRAPVYAERTTEPQEEQASALAYEELPESSLLPPPQPETPFPTMPLVSSLPGTTASPIRLPFGNKKGELIDMPGLKRGGLDEHVQEKHKLDLVMTTRPTVKQHNIKPGQSLLLGGGLVRITPLLDENDPSTIVMAYPFVPLDAHVTSTDKAVGTQAQQRESGLETILADHAGAEIQSAGTFSLRTDVTKSRAGPMLRAGVDFAKLPFRVYATDVLIEGVGWVELVCQVRKGYHAPPVAPVLGIPEVDAAATTAPPASEDITLASEPFKPYGGGVSPPNPEDVFPRVEIFTPRGKFIGQRPCLGAWQLWRGSSAHTGKTLRMARPRKPMSGAKKAAKMMAREASAS